MTGVVVALYGPTASGKSVVAEALADLLGTEVVSADAMQAYRGLPILTNQPERPTALVGIWPLDHEGSVGEYAPLAHRAVDELVARSGHAVVAGGTGLYLRAAVADLDLPPAPAPGSRERWEAVYDELGPDRVHALLAGLDARAAAAVHPNDRRRVVRALELHELGASLQPWADRLWTGRTRHPTVVVGLEVERDRLAARIELRTREMLRRGAAAEAARAAAGPLSAQAAQVIGLRELTSGLPEDDAAAEITRRTRAYARRQRTWMRRVAGLAGVEAADRPVEAVVGEIAGLVRRARP